MKRILGLIVTFMLLLIFIGCSDKNNENINDPTPNEPETIEEDPQEDPKENEGEDQEPQEKEPGSLYIRYVLNNGKSDVVVKITSLEDFKLLEPKRDGYEFDCWYSDSEINFEFDPADLVMPTDEKDITVYAYANWTVKRYRVKYYCGDTAVMSRLVLFGESVPEPQALAKSGYRFIGWDNDSSYVTEDMDINAIYVKDDSCKNIMVVLGNWMNNDGTISATMKARLDLALKAYSEFDISYIVVTGGMANSAAGISEAAAMYNYLVAHGISGSIIIKEDQSMSTQQNATYTMTKLENYNFDNLIIVSTIEHFVNYQTIKFFNDAARNNTKIRNKEINIMIYTNNGTY